MLDSRSAASVSEREHAAVCESLLNYSIAGIVLVREIDNRARIFDGDYITGIVRIPRERSYSPHHVGHGTQVPGPIVGITDAATDVVSRLRDAIQRIVC